MIYRRQYHTYKIARESFRRMLRRLGSREVLAEIDLLDANKYLSSSATHASIHALSQIRWWGKSDSSSAHCAGCFITRASPYPYTDQCGSSCTLTPAPLYRPMRDHLVPLGPPSHPSLLHSNQCHMKLCTRCTSRQMTRGSHTSIRLRIPVYHLCAMIAVRQCALRRN